jgi:AAA family ATP:ADP antiporter
MIVVSLLFGALVPFVSVENQAAAAVLFVFVPVGFAAVFASVWLLAADLLQESGTETRRRAYTWMGIAAMLGGFAGGLHAKFLGSLVSARFLVLAGALLLLVVAWLVTKAHRTYPVERRPVIQPVDPAQIQDLYPGLLSHSLVLIRNPYVLGLIGLSSMVAICGLLIEFQFYAFTMITGRTSTNFFANFYVWLNLVGLLLQVLAGSWIQSRFGTGVALMILPLGLLGGTALVVLNASLLTRSALRVIESGLKSSTHRSAWEQTYLPIGAEHRDVTRALIDGLSTRVAEGFGAGALFVWLSLLSNPTHLNLLGIAGAITICLVFWIYFVFYLLGRGCGQTPESEDRLRLPDG